MTLNSNSNGVLLQELQDIERMFAELTQAIGMDMKDELLALFFPTLDECLDGLAQAIPEQDTEQIINLTHKIKGAAAQLGATSMTAYCKNIEIAVKQQDTLAISTQFAQLQHLGQQISEQLRVV